MKQVSLRRSARRSLFRSLLKPDDINAPHNEGNRKVKKEYRVQLPVIAKLFACSLVRKGSMDRVADSYLESGKKESRGGIAGV